MDIILEPAEKLCSQTVGEYSFVENKKNRQTGIERYCFEGSDGPAMFCITGEIQALHVTHGAAIANRRDGAK